MRLSSVLFATALALFACRSNDNNPGGDGGGGGGGGGDGNMGSDGFVTIQQIQGSGLAALTAVKVKDVVVTAIDTRSTNSSLGNFWVEEPEGGAFSGVLVHGAPTTAVASLVVGDIVTITGGQKDEFALSSDTSGNTDTEIDTPTGGTLTVTVTGSGALPTPVPVDALMIGQASTAADCKTNETGCPTNVQWEMYEGVLITATTTSGGLTVFGTPSGSAANKLTFNTNGQIDVEATLADFPTLKGGDCLASITGVLDYFFQYNLLPTTTGDVATGGAGCPVREQASGGSAGLCENTTDDDGNGFADCLDLSCQTGSGAWLDPDNCDHATNGATCGCSTNLAAAGGINSIDTGTTATFAPVILNNVIVTAVSNTGFWVADAKAGVQNGGLFVFTSTAPAVTVGETLTTLQGLAEDFGRGSGSGDLKELEFEDATIGSAGATVTPTPLSGGTLATIIGLQSGVPFTGTLVQFANVKVTTAPTSANHNQATMSDGTTTFTMDDEAFFGYGAGSGTANVPVGTCFKTLTGVMDLDTFDPQLRTINPRGSDDMVSGGTCK
jgi:hypothetical protein|nr:hypothetical protein [Kofleriaceae bacterium]